MLEWVGGAGVGSVFAKWALSRQGVELMAISL